LTATAAATSLTIALFGAAEGLADGLTMGEDPATATLGDATGDGEAMTTGATVVVSCGPIGGAVLGNKIVMEGG
jgi:hypothetical protein